MTDGCVRCTDVDLSSSSSSLLYSYPIQGVLCQSKSDTSQQQQQQAVLGLALLENIFPNFNY